MDATYKTSDKLVIAENYYNAMLAKDFDKMSEYLHDNVYFSGPLAEMYGKEAVVLAAKNFGEMLQNIEIRSRFSNDNQIMFAYDMTLPAPIGKFRATVLMEFKGKFISTVELFYDARLFEQKRVEIFAK